MNWNETIDGLLLIGSLMIGSTAVAMCLALTIRHFFPRDPDYTYTLRHKNGMKTKVVLPPGLPEAERRKVLNEAYRRLGVNVDEGA